MDGKAVSALLADAGATAGTHTVEVKRLAKAQQLATKALPDKDAALGAGATTRTLGSGAGNNTLERIARAMREAGLDARVSAQGKGHALSPSGPTGAENTIRISVEGDPALGTLLSHGNGKPDGISERAAARDARLVVDGKAVRAASKRVDGAIAGVSLNPAGLGTSEVTVGRDPAAVAGKVKDLVAACNTLGMQPGGANDVLAGRLEAEIARVLDAADPKALAEVGISRKDGVMVLDEAKPKAAGAGNPDKLADLFGKPGGLAERFAARAGEQLRHGGMPAEQAATVKGRMDQLSVQKVRVTEVMQAQARMLAQQYARAGAGGSSLFGPSGQARPPSRFDFMA